MEKETNQEQKQAAVKHNIEQKNRLRQSSPFQYDMMISYCHADKELIQSSTVSLRSRFHCLVGLQ